MPTQLHPSQEKLHSLFDYDPEGFLIRKKTGYRTNLTKPKMYDRVQSYYQTQIEGSVYTTHVLIYIWHHGQVTLGNHINHMDGNKFNCKIENLKEIPALENKILGATGYQAYEEQIKAVHGKDGVHYIPFTNTWHVYHKGPNRDYISWFENEAEAQAEYTLWMTGVYANA